MKYLHKENNSHKFIASYCAPNYRNLLICDDEIIVIEILYNKHVFYISIKE